MWYPVRGMAILVRVKPEVPAGTYLPLQEAATWYDVNPATLYRMLRASKLTRHRRSGDKRTYLAVAELERELRPKPVEEKGNV